MEQRQRPLVDQDMMWIVDTYGKETRIRYWRIILLYINHFLGT